MSTNPPPSAAEEADRQALELAEAVRRHLSGAHADHHLFGRTNLLMRAATAAEPVAVQAGLDGLRLSNLVEEVRRRAGRPGAPPRGPCPGPAASPTS